MASLGTATLIAAPTTSTTSLPYVPWPGDQIDIVEIALVSVGTGTGFDVPEVGIIWPNGVNVNT